VETSLLHSLGPTLPSSAVVVHLDKGTVRRAPGSETWYDAKAPPYASLVAELQRCMGKDAAYKALRSQVRNGTHTHANTRLHALAPRAHAPHPYARAAGPPPPAPMCVFLSMPSPDVAHAVFFSFVPFAVC
jgi:hypothetical protein